MKKKFIPFGMWPANWGLSGTRRKEAEAEYYLDGEDLERELAKIRFEGRDLELKLLQISRNHNKISELDYDYQALALMHENDSKEFKQKKAFLDLKHEIINAEEYDLELLELNHIKDTFEYDDELINIELKHGKITENEAEKRRATLRNEPWFQILDTEFLNRPDLGSGLNFELDWNPQFIESLIQQGYTASSEEELINQWFTQVCYEIFERDKEELESQSNIIPMGLRTQKNTTDGKGEYS